MRDLPADMLAAIAAYTGPVTVCPPNTFTDETLLPAYGRNYRTSASAKRGTYIRNVKGAEEKRERISKLRVLLAAGETRAAIMNKLRICDTTYTGYLREIGK